MANLSDLFPSSGGGSLPGGMTKDPRFLPMVDATGVLGADNVGSSVNANNAAFWSGGTTSSMANIGAVRTTATAGTYGTICDITGRGYLFHVLPPLQASTLSTISFRITVDGVEYVIEKVGELISNNNTGRLLLGACVLSPSYSSFYTGNGSDLLNFGQSISTVGSFRAANGAWMYQPWRILMEGMPCVFFEESLKVETKVSTLNASDTYSQYSAATYKLL